MISLSRSASARSTGFRRLRSPGQHDVVGAETALVRRVRACVHVWPCACAPAPVRLCAGVLACLRTLA
eukprot:4360039-Alexandrium_andersonii.AAC.1